MAKTNNAVQIHKQIYDTYGPNVMSNDKIRQLCHLFQERKMNIIDEECRCHSILITDDLLENMNEKISETDALQLSAKAFMGGVNISKTNFWAFGAWSIAVSVIYFGPTLRGRSQ